MKIAIIGAGYMAGLFAERAKVIGYSTYCFAWEKGATAKDLVDRFFPISITEREKILAICREIGINGIVSTTELTVPIANYIANMLKLPANPIEVMDNITDKSWQREKCTGAKNICQPRYFRAFCLEDVNVNEFPLTFPVIIKPVAEGGKRGIEVADDMPQLFEKIKKSIDADKRKKGIIIEEFIARGKEYSVESLSFEGKHQIIQITEKISSGPPHCVELGHSQPARLSSAMIQKVIVSIKEILSVIGFMNGTTHTEIKIVDDKIYLIEINARPGGDHIAHPLTLLSTGYDYLGEALKVCVGIKPTSINEGSSIMSSGVRFVTAQTAYLKPIFDTCDDKTWLYRKHVESEDLSELNHNDCSHTNYIIYCSKSIPKELEGD